MSLTEEITFDKDGIPPTGGMRFPLVRKLFLTLLIILVASLSFGLGRLTGGERSGIKLEYDLQLTTDSSQPPANTTQSASTINATKSSPTAIYKTGEVVASSKGTKYHYPHCPGAKQISDKNKITFASANAAEASGYTLAANCRPR